MVPARSSGLWTGLSSGTASTQRAGLEVAFEYGSSQTCVGTWIIKDGRLKHLELFVRQLSVMEDGPFCQAPSKRWSRDSQVISLQLHPYIIITHLHHVSAVLYHPVVAADPGVQHPILNVAAGGTKRGNDIL